MTQATCIIVYQTNRTRTKGGIRFLFHGDWADLTTLESKPDRPMRKPWKQRIRRGGRSVTRSCDPHHSTPRDAHAIGPETAGTSSFGSGITCLPFFGKDRA